MELLIGLLLASPLLIYFVWTNHFKKWTCTECGQQQKGREGKRTGFHFHGVCEDCVYTPISHAQYLRSFGIEPTLKAVSKEPNGN